MPINFTGSAPATSSQYLVAAWWPPLPLDTSFPNEPTARIVTCAASGRERVPNRPPGKVGTTVWAAVAGDGKMSLELRRGAF
jgi:hypothetical protein